MRTPFAVRPISPADAAEVLSLMRVKAIEDGIRAEVATTEETLRTIPEKVTVLIAVADDSIVGYIAYSFIWSLYANKDFVWLDDLYVEKSYRKRGVATKLMQAMCRHAQRVGAHRIDWIYRATNDAAAAFYRRLAASVYDEYKFARLDQFLVGTIADESEKGTD